MDLFRLGLRNFMGVLLPGALVVLLFMYVLGIGAFSMNLHPHLAFLSQAFPLAALFLMSYLIGSLLRLNSADNVDSKSAAYQQWRLKVARSNEFGIVEIGRYFFFRVSDSRMFRLIRSSHQVQPLMEVPSKYLDDLWKDPLLVKPGRITPADVSVDRVWRTDLFPYPVWHLVKLKLFHPEEAFDFFLGYRENMRWEDEPGKLGKEFLIIAKQ